MHEHCWTGEQARIHRRVAVMALALNAALAVVSARIPVLAAEREAGPVITREGQTSELARFAGATVARLLPTWTEEEKGRYARGIQTAVLGATDRALSEEEVAALRATIERTLDGFHHRPARETLDLTVEIAAWHVKDIVTSPAPDPKGAAELGAQLTELAKQLGQAMEYRLGLPNEMAERAVTRGCDRWVGDHLNHPFYRFDRKPLGPDGIRRADEIAAQRIEETRPRLERLIESNLEAEATAALMQAEADGLVHGVLFAVVRECCGWRVCPIDESQRSAAGAAQLASTEAWVSAAATGPLRLVLEALLAGAEAMAGPPGFPEDLLRLLRSPARTAYFLAYNARITVPWPGRSAPAAIEAECRVEGERGEVRVSNVSGLPPPSSFLLMPGLTWRVQPGSGEVLDAHGESLALYGGGAERVEPVSALAQFPTVGSLLLSAGDALDAERLTWHHVGTDAEGLDLYEGEPTTARGDAAEGEGRYRCWLSPQLGCVVRSAVLAADGSLVAETAFDEIQETPTGKRLPLRSVTKIAAGVTVELARQDESTREVRVPRGACTVTTVYEWSEEEQLRLPVSRRVVDGRDALLCTIDFQGYRFLPEFEGGR